MPCIKFKMNDGTCGILTVGNEPIPITVRGKTYLFEILNSGGAEPVTKNGNPSSQEPPKAAWIALQCKTAKSVRCETSRGTHRGKPIVLKSIYADHLSMADAVGETEVLCDSKLSAIVDLLKENGIEISIAALPQE